MRDFFLAVEKRLREKGMTIEEFSNAVEISPATYHRWQAGAVPRGSTVRRVARVLDLPLEQFFRPLSQLAAEPEAQAALARGTRAPISTISGSADELLSVIRFSVDAVQNANADEDRRHHAKVLLVAAELLYATTLPSQ